MVARKSISRSPKVQQKQARGGSRSPTGNHPKKTHVQQVQKPKVQKSAAPSKKQKKELKQPTPIRGSNILNKEDKEAKLTKDVDANNEESSSEEEIGMKTKQQKFKTSNKNAKRPTKSDEEEEDESHDESSSDEEVREQGKKSLVKGTQKGGRGAKNLRSSQSARKIALAEEGTSEESSDENSVAISEGDSKDGDHSTGSKDEANERNLKGKFFSDDNAAWLKPKKEKSQLLSSDEDDGKDDDDDVDDDEMVAGHDDSEEEMEVERKSRLLDAEKEAEEEEAEEELRETVAKHTAIYHLPTKEEVERDVDRVVPPSELKSHVESILEVLADFKKRREPGRARSEYIEQLASFIAELYGYLPELVEYFLTMFSPPEALEFIEYSDRPRPMVIRTNTLKTRRKDLAVALMKRGVALDPLASWSKVGLKISESPVPIGATPEYLSGHYMLQSAASMCPVLALSPQAKERILDMSAAPGGKTSYIAQLMGNTGVVFANDLKKDRQKATVANMHRLGVKNVVACTHDGRKLSSLFKHYKFDRVLLDAPCSGLGVISRDPSVKVQRTIADVNKCAHLQKELLLAAIDVLNHKSKTSNGVMVYSTCSVSIAENEEVINYALQKRDIKLIDTGLEFGK